MIGTIRRHQKWLWALIIAATIVSFVMFFNPSTRYGGGSDQSSTLADAGSINGEPIPLDKFNAARREGMIFFRLHFGDWPSDEKMRQAGFDLNNWAYQRLLLDAKAKELKIDVTTAAAARFTKEIFGLGPDDTLPADKFRQFVEDELMRKGGLSLEDFDRFVKHQVAQQVMASLVGMSGKLITSKEAEFFYRRENQPIETEVVFFQLTNFTRNVMAPPKEIEDFYTKKQAEYRLPERIQINYIMFDPTNFLSAADKEIGGITNLDQKVEQVYTTRGASAYNDANGKPLPPDEAKKKIKQEVRKDYALVLARKKATEFITELFKGHDDDHPFTTDDLAKLAKEQNMKVRTTEPFDAKTGPKDITLPKQALRLVFSLRDDDPDDKEKSMLYPSSPLVTEDGVYVIGLNKRFPSQNQPLEAIRDQVTDDYRRAQAVDLVKSAGEAFENFARTDLAKGRTFDAICAERHVKPVTLPAFSLTTPSIPEFTDKAEFEELQGTVFSLPSGRNSRFVATPDGGFVAYVKAREPVDEAKLQTELPDYLARMRAQRQNAAFAQWFQKQAQDMHLVIPPAFQTKSRALG